jgi:amidohydrolase
VGIDPIVTSAQMISAFQTIVSRQLPLTESAAVVTVGSIHGGNRSNIIPEQVEMKGTLRALNADVRTKIHEKVRLIATNVAESMGASVEIQLPYSTSYPVTYNDPVLTAEMAPVLDAVAGPGNSVARVPETAAEDFSFFAEKVPGLYFILGGRPSGISIAETADHHTPGFYVDESGLILGVRAMTALTLSYLKTHAEN